MPVDTLEKLIVEKTKEVLKTRHDLVSYTQLLVCVADEVWKSTGRRLPGREYGGWDTVRHVWAKYCEKDPYWKRVTAVLRQQLPPLHGERLQRIKERVHQMLSERKAKIDEEYRLGLITETEARLGKPNAVFDAVRDFGLGMDAVRAIARRVWAKAVPVQAPPVNPENKVNGSETENISELVVFLANENMTLKKALAAAEKEMLGENRFPYSLQNKVGDPEKNEKIRALKAAWKNRFLRVVLKQKELEKGIALRCKEIAALRLSCRKLEEQAKALASENARLTERNKRLLEANQLLIKSLNRKGRESCAAEISYKAGVRLPNLNVHNDDTSPFYNAHRI
jgi:hypothetical protein